jgi:hypothetical protein
MRHCTVGPDRGSRRSGQSFGQQSRTSIASNRIELLSVHWEIRSPVSYRYRKSWAQYDEAGGPRRGAGGSRRGAGGSRPFGPWADRHPRPGPSTEGRAARQPHLGSTTTSLDPIRAPKPALQSVPKTRPQPDVSDPGPDHSLCRRLGWRLPGPRLAIPRRQHVTTQFRARARCLDRRRCTE